MESRSFTVAPGRPFPLRDWDPNNTPGYDGQAEAKADIAANLQKLNDLQEMLYAQGKRALLVVLQGMDTAGKDGIIRHVMGAFDPQGVQVSSFKVPNEEELAHDYLWRVHKVTPRRGMVAIFNRSHYEDVLVVRVKELVAAKVWRKRYGHINEFEQLLSDNGVTIVKFYLHISKEEQAERLRDRQTDPKKQWKFNPGDLDERQRWDDYARAYEEALSRCNTAVAPWYVIPANRKWYRNLVVSQILISTMEEMGLAFPEPVADIDKYVIPE